jgi:hemin uptake protein HemP
MTVQLVNIGNVVNDGTGDDLRTAFEKANNNFTELSNTIRIVSSNDLLVRYISNILIEFDFGTITNSTRTHILQFILQNIDSEFGTITSPTSLNLDLGSITNNDEISFVTEYINEINGGTA